jgi:hypothetical protein
MSSILIVTHLENPCPQNWFSVQLPVAEHWELDAGKDSTQIPFVRVGHDIEVGRCAHTIVSTMASVNSCCPDGRNMITWHV